MVRLLNITKGFIALGALCLMVAGCATKPTSFYLLSSLNTVTASKGAAGSSGASPTVSVGVGPVVLPQHLDRPQIVTRLSQNKVELNEFNQWAGALRGNFSEVLANNLSILIPTNRISLYPWKRSKQIDYQVAVHVDQFDVVADGSAALIARWTLSKSDDNEPLLEKKSTISKPVSAQTYEAKVAAMSQLIEDLSKRIAAAINAMPRKKR
jgi:uncharacterized lipoprotein YmbA